MAGARDRHPLTLVLPSPSATVRWDNRGCIMQTSVLDRVEAGSVTVMPLVAGGDQHIYAHDIRTTVARILVGLPFALARLIEATSRSLASKSTRPRR